MDEYTDLMPNRNGHSSYTLGGTVQSNPVILSPVAHSSGRKQPDSGLKELIAGLNCKIASIGNDIVKRFFPQGTSRLQAARQAVLDAPLFGSPDNHSFSSAQVNISKLNESLSSSLGYSGQSHIDRHDDPMSLSVLVCLSRLEVGTFPGNFYLGETDEWCCLEPFSILLLRGTGPHGGTQAIPDGNPKDHEKRINVILYPRREFVNRTLPLLLPCYDSTRLSDYSFFYDGEACFGTKDYQQAWCSRELFRHFVKSNKEFGSQLDGRKLEQAFITLAGSRTQYIDPTSDEGKGILEAIKKANRILEDLRPPWQNTETGQNRMSTVKDASRDTIRSRLRNQAVPPMPCKLNSQSQQSHTTQDSQSIESRDIYQLQTLQVRNREVAKTLLRTELFDTVEIERELKSLRGTASLCPPKFRHTRIPRMSFKSNFGRVPSARPPPDTAGTVLVEEMIQLGELCHWIAQKNEHLWLYRQALSETFYMTLLELQPMFDLTWLKQLFKYKNHRVGAGICSMNLMEAIEDLVEKTKSPGCAGTKFTFDAHEILGNQYQRKFCCSVQVVMKPYKGLDLDGHKAQHFREVFHFLN